MKIIRGTGVSEGITKGKIEYFHRIRTEVEKTSGLGTEAEKSRLTAAQAACVRRLEEQADRFRSESEETAALLETHAMLVEDEDFTACILAHIDENESTAEYAAEQAGAEFAAMFECMDDDYMCQRAADIRDVTRRLLDELTGTQGAALALSEPVILCADDLSPSETLGMERGKLLGFITRGGSPNSHTAILARTMGIPAICAAGDILRADCDGLLCCMDGNTGEAVIDPDPETLRRWEEKLARQQNRSASLEWVRGQEDITPDGRKMALYCNIGSPDDVQAVLANDGGGVGLFRSEFLFLNARTLPDEETQFRVYRAVAEAMDAKPVVIRTLDVGADKQGDCFDLKPEANPALGLRAIRLCLERPELLRTQLRAVCRASAFGDVRVMFPMITSVWEVRACREVCRNVMAELEREGLAFDANMPVGIMVETPAAVLMAQELAAEVDFFCIGTNDLTQYTLACDRQANDLGRFFDPRHPAVLRGVRMTADAAHAAGIPVSICGDLAAEPDLLSAFLDMGIDALSVPPARVLPLRAVLRGERT